MSSPPRDRTAFCTIVSKNYLALARAWSARIEALHPGASQFVLLADRVDGAFDPSQEPFDLIEAEQLGIPSFRNVAFQYGLAELNALVKPFWLDYLLRERDLVRLLYIDPDAMLFARPDHAFAVLESSNVVLTPHVLSPLPDDGKTPDEVSFLVSGTYNAGFLGVARSAETHRFLRWWGSRLLDRGFAAPEIGLFADQKWLDLTPALFEGVAVLRDRTYNVAYWNLHERGDLAVHDGIYRFSEAPLTLFHFSGLDMDHPELISKFQNRFRFDNVTLTIRALFEGYVAEVKEKGHDRTRRLPYAYGAFDDGVAIPALARRLYQREPGARERWKDPFSTIGSDPFREWLLEATHSDSPVPRVLWAIYDCRADLQAQFPASQSEHARRLLEWGLLWSNREYGFAPYFLDDFRARLSRIGRGSARLTDAARNDWRSRYGRVAWCIREARERHRRTGVYDAAPIRPWKRIVERLMTRELFRRARFWVWVARSGRKIVPSSRPEQVPPPT